LRPSARERGYTRTWEKARKQFLLSHPCCAMCAQEGRVRAATVVNHKVAHRGNQELFWSVDNWEALCKRHHDSDAQRIDRGSYRRVGLDGWPLD
jgi:5-methylcytosine-specific restriction protein A